MVTYMLRTLQRYGYIYIGNFAYIWYGALIYNYIACDLAYCACLCSLRNVTYSNALCYWPYFHEHTYTLY